MMRNPKRSPAELRPTCHPRIHDPPVGTICGGRTCNRMARASVVRAGARLYDRTTAFFADVGPGSGTPPREQ